jgi:F0F1-type ATP synthase alpha subunit
MDIRAEEISKIIRDQISGFTVEVNVAEVGSVISIGDGIARVHGIERAMAGEMLEFTHGVFGIALNLEEQSVGAVLLGDFKAIKEGDVVKRTGRIISVPVGDEMLGRVVNALGQPIDGKGPIQTKKFLPIERLAPGVVDRQPVKEPMQTPSTAWCRSVADNASSSSATARQGRPRSGSTRSSTSAARTSSASTTPSVRSSRRSRRWCGRSKKTTR